jgi:DtxR family Mn-dependent transcriptional regulator
MSEHITSAMEDYLKAIYKLTAGYQRATTNKIAEEMDVAPASATGMIQKLAGYSPPLVVYQKHQGVILTPEGESAALEVIRHHRLLESYLHEHLGYSWDEVHSEADRLEHVISEELEEKIAQALGNPSHDPHGDPIPTRDFQLPQEEQVPLSQLRPTQAAIILRVENTNPDLLRFLADHGLVPQAELVVQAYSPFDQNIQLIVRGREKPVVIGYPVSSQIYVSHVSSTR